MTIVQPELLLRSPDATWDNTRWEQLPDDDNRYEVIDGVLSMSTAPSLFHECGSVSWSPTCLPTRPTRCCSETLLTLPIPIVVAPIHR